MQPALSQYKSWLNPSQMGDLQHLRATPVPSAGRGRWRRARRNWAASTCCRHRRTELPPPSWWDPGEVAGRIWRQDILRIISSWWSNIGHQQPNIGSSWWLDTVMAIKTSYKWLFLWDYTFYKWGYKYLELTNGHNCINNWQHLLINIFTILL